VTLRPRSRKRDRLYRDHRAPLVASLLELRPWCERCSRARSTEVHEIKSRARGGSLLDPANLACLCHDCHSWITTHPEAAHAEGWLDHSWEPDRESLTGEGPSITSDDTP